MPADVGAIKLITRARLARQSRLIGLQARVAELRGAHSAPCTWQRASWLPILLAARAKNHNCARPTSPQSSQPLSLSLEQQHKSEQPVEQFSLAARPINAINFSPSHSGTFTPGLSLGVAVPCASRSYKVRAIRAVLRPMQYYTTVRHKAKQEFHFSVQFSRFSPLRTGPRDRKLANPAAGPSFREFSAVLKQL